MKLRALNTLCLVCVPLFAALTVGLASAQDIPWASSAEEVGMSSERLERINQAMERHIDAGNIQGAVTAVARRGKLVHFQTHGVMDVPNNRPMTEDSLFIMMSSTKPVLGGCRDDDDRRGFNPTDRSGVKMDPGIQRHAGGRAGGALC